MAVVGRKLYDYNTQCDSEPLVMVVVVVVVVVACANPRGVFAVRQKGSVVVAAAVPLLTPPLQLRGLTPSYIVTTVVVAVALARTSEN